MSVSPTAVIGILILVIILSLAILAIRKQKKKKEALSLYIQGIINEHQLEIDQKEAQPNFLLAMDSNARKIVHIKALREKPETIVIDLSDIKTCQMKGVEQSFFMDNEKKRKETITTRFGLELTYRNNDELSHILFYDYIQNNMAQLGELKAKALEWDRRINEVIGKSRTKV